MIFVGKSSVKEMHEFYSWQCKRYSLLKLDAHQVCYESLPLISVIASFGEHALSFYTGSSFSSLEITEKGTKKVVGPVAWIKLVPAPSMIEINAQIWDLFTRTICRHVNVLCMKVFLLYRNDYLTSYWYYHMCWTM